MRLVLVSLSIFLVLNHNLHSIDCVSSINVGKNCYAEWTESKTDRNQTVTTFYVTSTWKDIDPSNAWIGFGFSNIRGMDKGNEVVCELTNNGAKVAHYYNEKNHPKPFLGELTFGISDASVKQVGSNLTCTFTRVNDIDNEHYMKLSKMFNYWIFAFGKGSMGNHHKDKTIAKNEYTF